MEILEFYLTTLNNNLVIGKFPITIWMFLSFPLWPFGLEVWNDRHVLWVGFGVWHNIMPKMFLFSWCKHWKAYFSFPYVQKRLKVCLCILWVKKKKKKRFTSFQCWGNSTGNTCSITLWRWKSMLLLESKT